MEEETRLGELHPRRRHTVRRLLRGLAVAALAGVGAALAWLCVGVTHWGPYTLVGPGFGGTVRTREGQIRVRPGWRRSVEADFTRSVVGFQLPDRAHRFLMLTPERNYSAERVSTRVQELRYRAGWIVVVPLPPFPPNIPRAPLKGVARLP